MVVGVVGVVVVVLAAVAVVIIVSLGSTHECKNSSGLPVFSVDRAGSLRKWGPGRAIRGRHFPVQGISPYKGFPLIRDFPL